MAEEEGAGSGWSSEMQSGDEAMRASDWPRDAVTTLADVPWLLERAATGDSRFAAAREGFAGGLIACVVDSCTVPLVFSSSAGGWPHSTGVRCLSRGFGARKGSGIIRPPVHRSMHKDSHHVARHVPQVCW